MLGKNTGASQRPAVLAYFTLATGLLQITNTQLVFVVAQFVRLESREYGLCQIVLWSGLNLA